MQVPCIREASKACSSCCRNPFLGHPSEIPNPSSQSTKTAVTPQHDFIAATISSFKPSATFTNHESLPPFTDMYSNLQNAYPLYSKTGLADQIRSREYYHLSHFNHVCLDYVGRGLFSYSQQQDHYSRAGIASTSSSPPMQHLSSSQVPFFDISYKPASLNSLLRNDSKRSEFELVVKERVMKFMNISGDDYSMVFTANQASAFKLLANSYPFQSNKKLLTVYDYKSEAAEAMIESSMKKGAKVMTATFSWPSLRINSKELRKMIMHKNSNTKRGLFVFPLQSRMTGARYPYQWMNIAQEKGWHVLLDADALGDKDMETLGLTLFQPDFIVSSFFKVFGENPSGFSCLFVKKSRIPELNLSSKSIEIVSLVPTFWRLSKKSNIAETESSKDQTLGMLLMEEEEAGLSSSSSSSSSEETFEFQIVKEGGKMEKELSFSAFVSEKVDSEQQVKNEASSSCTSSSDRIEFKGLDHADELGLILISGRVRCHVNWLVNAFLCLRHPHSENGVALVKLYGPKISIDRGPCVAFNVFDWKGEKVDPLLVQKLADRNNISLVCGFLQHLWFKDVYKEEKEQILEKEKAEMVKEGYWDNRGKSDHRIPVVTVSIGFLNNFEDLYRLWAFVSRFLDADFVEKERWRYMAINQTTVEV